MEKVGRVIRKTVPILTHFYFKNETILTTTESKVLVALSILKQHINFQYKLLTCISGIDFLYLKHRFCVVYELLSMSFNSRVRIKVFTNEIIILPSITPIFKNAN